MFADGRNRLCRVLHSRSGYAGAEVSSADRSTQKLEVAIAEDSVVALLGNKDFAGEKGSKLDSRLT